MAKRRGRGEGSYRELPSGLWQAALPGRKRAGRTKSFPTKAEALAWLRENAGRPGGAAGTLSDWIDVWLPIQRANTEAGTWRRDEEVIRSFIRPQLGSVRLLNLTGNRINAWLADLHSAGRSDDERHRSWATLRKVLRSHDAYPRGNLDSVRPPKVRRAEALFLDPEEYRRLCLAADRFPSAFPFLPALVRVWVECCCRPREGLALKWEDYDPATGIVRVRRALTTRGKGGGKVPKTERSARDVPLSSAAKAALDVWRTLAGPSPWMFAGDRGGHRWYTHFRETVWGPLAERAGLPDHTPKSLRHAGASLLLAAGGSLLAVARRMGHSSPQLILRVYGHTMRDDQRKLAGIFEGLTVPHDVRTAPAETHEKP